MREDARLALGELDVLPRLRAAHVERLDRDRAPFALVDRVPRRPLRPLAERREEDVRPSRSSVRRRRVGVHAGGGLSAPRWVCRFGGSTLARAARTLGHTDGRDGRGKPSLALEIRSRPRANPSIVDEIRALLDGVYPLARRSARISTRSIGFSRLSIRIEERSDRSFRRTIRIERRSDRSFRRSDPDRRTIRSGSNDDPIRIHRRSGPDRRTIRSILSTIRSDPRTIRSILSTIRRIERRSDRSFRRSVGSNDDPIPSLSSAPSSARLSRCPACPRTTRSSG